MSYIFQPVLKPPVLERECSSEAKLTFASLERKYMRLQKLLQFPEDLPQPDAVNYYQCLYKASFGQAASKSEANGSLMVGSHEDNTPHIEDKYQCHSPVCSSRSPHLSGLSTTCHQESSREFKHYTRNETDLSPSFFDNKQEVRMFLTRDFIQEDHSEENYFSMSSSDELFGVISSDYSNPRAVMGKNSFLCPEMVRAQETQNSELSKAAASSTVRELHEVSQYLEQPVAFNDKQIQETDTINILKHQLSRKLGPHVACVGTELSRYTTSDLRINILADTKDIVPSAYCHPVQSHKINISSYTLSHPDDSSQNPSEQFNSGTLTVSKKCMQQSEADPAPLDPHTCSRQLASCCDKPGEFLSAPAPQPASRADFELRLSGFEWSQKSDNTSPRQHLTDSPPMDLFSDGESLVNRIAGGCGSISDMECQENPLQEERNRKIPASFEKKMKHKKAGKKKSSSMKKGKPSLAALSEDVTDTGEPVGDLSAIYQAKGNSSKNSIQKEGKRKSDPLVLPVKKSRTNFKPPTKPSDKMAVPSSSSGAVSVETRQDEDVSSLKTVDVSSLTPEEQQHVCSLLEESDCLTLTVLYGPNVMSATTFYTAADHAKKKSFILKPKMSGIGMILEQNTSRSFFVPVDLIKGVMKKPLLKALSSSQCVKVIANCKDFLTALYTLISADNTKMIECHNLEDPVVACWLLDSDQQPSSLLQLCQTARLPVEPFEQDWASVLLLVKRLMLALRQRLLEDSLWSVYTQIEMKLLPVLAHMETQTLQVDTQLLTKFSHILKSKIKILEEKAYEIAGHKFSLNSHIQLRQILYEELALDQMLPAFVQVGKTETSNLKSTGETALNLLASVHSLPAVILEHRQMQKLLSTYVEGILTCVVNGYLATHWDQTAAATGRLTSSQPNIQAIPRAGLTISHYETNYIKGSEKTQSIDFNAREAFVSRPGCLFLAADFQQIELRVLAHLSGDLDLQSLFEDSQTQDIFVRLATQWYKKSAEEVTSTDREQTKRVVYSVLYGIGKEKLSEYLKVKPDIAQEIISSFSRQFPSIERFVKTCWSCAQERGYTLTICGRRRYFPHINSSSLALRSQARRQAVNFCVQGSAADICKLAMLAVTGKLLLSPHLSCRLLLQIHDELIWEVAGDQLKEITGVIRAVMEDSEAICGDFLSLLVPLKVMLSCGKSWAHLQPVSVSEP